MDSDGDLAFINQEKDSGMASSNSCSDNVSPEKLTDANKQVGIINNIQNDYSDEPDETIGERLMGLTEMFPECIRNTVGSVIEYSGKGAIAMYKFSCNASWIFFTSSMILFAPVIFETERAQMEEMQRSQQKQVLLGPGSVGGMPPVPR